ncbi:MAG TPA: M13 family metallopeptidase [Bacteroidia bacterium]|nr:M13 family metallopeptidase [Bacteroidia bacterium]
MKTRIIVGFVAFGALFSFAVKNAFSGSSNYTAIDTKNFDTSVRPQDDFYEYVNGNWIKNNPIPATESGWGNFNVLNEKSQNALLSICNDAAKGTAAKGSNMQKIGDFYASGMDSAAIEKEKFSAVKPEMDEISKLKDMNGITPLIADMHKMQVTPGFGFFVMADQKDSKTNVAYIFQSGMGLPEKAFYKSDELKMFREEYKKHLTNMFGLMGDNADDAQKNSDMVFNLESMLADSAMSAVEQRDIEKQYNKMSVADLSKLCPNFNWTAYFKSIGVPDLKEVIVSQVSFMRQFNALLKSQPVDAWKAYIRWHFIDAVAAKLQSDVVNEHFHFYGTIMSGVQKIQPRWKRVLSATDGALGEALGQIYVERNFSMEAKQKVNVMVDNLIAAFEDRIKTRTWMSDPTKDKAEKKLQTILRKLGFPDKWRDYSGLNVVRGSYVRNFLNANKFDFQYNIGKLKKPVDRMEWGMTPATINAYYNPSNNEIVFPAGIMQAPFFDPNADDAVNYGAMGAIIGHELTHGFDDQGSQYDEVGNMVDWWTDDDRKNFEARTKKLSDQFSSFVAIDSLNLHVNGDLTLGENIADLGGLTIAYHAYMRSLTGKPEPPKIDGFTGQQRFFLSWAQGWRNSQRPAALIQQVKNNPHSPAKFRVLGPLSNLAEFYDAFGVKEGDKMWRKPEDRVEIW